MGFPRDRACAEAWAKGGPQAEQEERTKWRNKEKMKMESSINYLRKLQERAQEKRRLTELENKCDSEKGSDSEHELGTPLNQVSIDQKVEKNEVLGSPNEPMDTDMPDLEKVDLEELKDQTKT